LFVVDTINDDTEIIITGSTIDIQNAINDLRGSKIYANKHISNFTWDLDDEKYIILRIDDLDKLDSDNKNIDNAYGIILFDVVHGQNNIIGAGRLPRRGIEKYFNPPLSKLDRLKISFLTADGYFYDFNGRDHLLVFDIISLNQPGKYNTLITT
jgi:hypothetical protein